MRGYDGENLKDTDPKAKSLQEYKDAAGVDEGMNGLSSRFAFKILSKVFNFDPTEIAANPVHLMYVLEQQIVAECNEIMRSTGQPRKRYEESVLRFTKVNSQQMYVQAAQVVFGQDRKFQQKIVMYGYVTKGQVANTNPYSGMMQMMQPGQSGQSQFPSLQPGQNPFGGGGNPFGGGMPQFPPGSNPFQGLFGQ